MPWSISSHNNDDDNEDLHKLHKALSYAAGRDTILFCAQHDNHLFSVDSYPAAFGNSSLITIGAFEETTIRSFNTNQPNFIFPGNFVEERKDNIQTQSERKPDSGVASALAAGMTAMILNGAKLAAILEKTKDSPKVTEADFKGLHGRSMKDAFKRIGLSGPGELIPIWKICSEKPVADCMESGNHEAAFSILVEIICQLLGK